MDTSGGGAGGSGGGGGLTLEQLESMLASNEPDPDFEAQWRAQEMYNRQYAQQQMQRQLMEHRQSLTQRHHMLLQARVCSVGMWMCVCVCGCGCVCVWVCV